MYNFQCSVNFYYTCDAFSFRFISIIFITYTNFSVVEVDPFINGLWNIYTKVREAGIKQVCEFQRNSLII